MNYTARIQWNTLEVRDIVDADLIRLKQAIQQYLREAMERDPQRKKARVQIFLTYAVEDYFAPEPQEKAGGAR